MYYLYGTQLVPNCYSGNLRFSRVRFMPLRFYERFTLVPAFFVNWWKTEEDFRFNINKNKNSNNNNRKGEK